MRREWVFICLHAVAPSLSTSTRSALLALLKSSREGKPWLSIVLNALARGRVALRWR
jgi:hypothetical protein